MASWECSLKQWRVWNSDAYEVEFGAYWLIQFYVEHARFSTIVPIHAYVLCMASGSETNYFCVQSMIKPFSLRYSVVDKVFIYI